MTVAIAIKINNGLVLATDSASAIGEVNDNQARISHTYYNADKLFNLKKRYSIGCLTWGDGSINGVSISTLIKDFRKKLFSINKLNIKDVADMFISFLNEFICDEYDDLKVGFLIAGYSDKNKNTPEMYLIEIKEQNIEMNPGLVIWMFYLGLFLDLIQTWKFCLKIMVLMMIL